MLEQGVVDPVKVTRSAVQNAVSIAGMLLTTEALVTDIPEDRPAMPAGVGCRAAGWTSSREPRTANEFADDTIKPAEAGWTRNRFRAQPASAGFSYQRRNSTPIRRMPTPTPRARPAHARARGAQHSRGATRHTARLRVEVYGTAQLSPPCHASLCYNLPGLFCVPVRWFVGLLVPSHHSVVLRRSTTDRR